jgi:hypothetical protein
MNIQEFVALIKRLFKKHKRRFPLFPDAWEEGISDTLKDTKI